MSGGIKEENNFAYLLDLSHLCVNFLLLLQIRIEVNSIDDCLNVKTRALLNLHKIELIVMILYNIFLSCRHGLRICHRSYQFMCTVNLIYQLLLSLSYYNSIYLSLVLNRCYKMLLWHCQCEIKRLEKIFNSP